MCKAMMRGLCMHDYVDPLSFDRVDRIGACSNAAPKRTRPLILEVPSCFRARRPALTLSVVTVSNRAYSLLSPSDDISYPEAISAPLELLPVHDGIDLGPESSCWAAPSFSIVLRCEFLRVSTGHSPFIAGSRTHLKPWLSR